MKIHLVKGKTIRKYYTDQPGSRASFEEWLRKLQKTEWSKPEDITRVFRTANFLGNGTSRVVFDISGNNYRMICKYRFFNSHVRLYICWIGTHAEYDDLCARTEQYHVWKYKRQ